MPFSDNVGLGVSTAHQHLVDKIDYSGCRLFGFQFRKYVALIVGFVSRFASDESETATEKRTINDYETVLV